MHYLLFTTTSCPKCPEVKAYVLENINFDGVILDETNPEFPDKASEYGVTMAPTMIIFNDQEEEVFRGSEVYEMEDFLKS